MAEQMWRCENWEKCKGCKHKYKHNHDEYCDDNCTNGYGGIKGSICKPVDQTFHSASELTDILPAEAVIVRPIDSLTATLIFDLLEEQCPHSEGCAKRFCTICIRELKKKFCGG